MAATAVPLVLLGAIEVVLQGVGFGYQTRYFIKVGDSYTSNQCFGWRFFPPAVARTPPVTLIPATKPAGAIRIFVLGGSAAMGTPDLAYGMPRLLEVMLQQAYTGQEIEVYNLAMTAIGSHVVREIASECCRLDPDILVVYLGNNEVVGPYGPGTVFQPISGSLLLTRLSIGFRTLRIGQMIEALVQGSSAQRGSWRGLEMFTGNQIPADDPRLETAYQHLHRNLADIVKMARRAGAGVVLSTVATNLKDCPPFASLHQEGLTPEQLAEWQQHYSQGIELAGGDRQEEALTAYRAAAAIDDRYAELHFRTGRCFLDRGDYGQALSSFIAARDLDALRFRADSRINRVIRDLVQKEQESNILLVDGERALAGAPETKHGILGGELLFEHVHLRFDGNYLVARAIAETVQEMLTERLGPTETEEWIGRERCAELLALSEWAHFRMAAEIVRMTRRPPFTGQLDHERRLAIRKARLRGLKALAKARADSSLVRHRQAVERDGDDLILRIRLAELLQERRQYDAAAAQWRALIDKVRGVPSWHTQLGFALLDSGKKEQGIAELQKVLELRPQLADAHVNLALALKQDGQLDAAEARLQAALETDPGAATARINLALLLADQDRLEEAAEQYEKVLEADPGSVDARFGLATVLERQGREDQAVACYRQALEIDPEMVRAGNNLGHLLARQGQHDEALALLQQTIRNDPEYALAHFNMADLLLSLGRFSEAAAAYSSGLSLQPGNVNARINLAVTLQVLEQPNEAAEQYRELLRYEPEHVRAHIGLAWLLVSTDDPDLRDRTEAVRLADQAARLTGDDLEVLASLVTIYETAGEPDRANQLRSRINAIETGGR